MSAARKVLQEFGVHGLHDRWYLVVALLDRKILHLDVVGQNVSVYVHGLERDRDNPYRFKIEGVTAATQNVPSVASLPFEADLDLSGQSHYNGALRVYQP